MDSGFHDRIPWIKAAASTRPWMDPASTYQVVAALQKSGHSFDFVPIINAGHGAAETPYGKYRRAEFLVRHLRP